MKNTRPRVSWRARLLEVAVGGLVLAGLAALGTVGFRAALCGAAPVAGSIAAIVAYSLCGEMVWQALFGEE